MTAFLHELTPYLDEGARHFLDNVINDPFPGSEVRHKRVTQILLNQVMMAILEGQRSQGR